jgi:hypothetical protein
MPIHHPQPQPSRYRATGHKIYTQISPFLAFVQCSLGVGCALANPTFQGDNASLRVSYIQ